MLIAYNLNSINVSSKKFKSLNLNFYTQKTIFSNIKCFSNLHHKLNNLNYPFNLTVKKYVFIKYIIPIIVLIIIYIRSFNLVFSLFYFMFFFFIPDIFIYLYKKKEYIYILSDLSKITNNLILTTSTEMTICESLRTCLILITNKQFKKEFEKFLTNYEMYNLNMQKAMKTMRKKFSFLEYNMFCDLLLQGENDGKLLENLEMFSKTLDLSYFKILKYKESKRMSVVIISCLFCIINIALITLFPLYMQITENITNLFI